MGAVVLIAASAVGFLTGLVLIGLGAPLWVFPACWFGLSPALALGILGIAAVRRLIGPIAGRDVLRRVWRRVTPLS